jgi:hypothetical protein
MCCVGCQGNRKQPSNSRSSSGGYLSEGVQGSLVRCGGLERLEKAREAEKGLEGIRAWEADQLHIVKLQY